MLFATEAFPHILNGIVVFETKVRLGVFDVALAEHTHQFRRHNGVDAAIEIGGIDRNQTEIQNLRSADRPQDADKCRGCQSAARFLKRLRKRGETDAEADDPLSSPFR